VRATRPSLKRAYRAYEEPAFLYNIAQCYRQLGDKAEAIKFYRSYLRKVPEAPNREEVKSLVASLEAAMAEEKRAAENEVRPASPPSLSATTPNTAATAATLTASAPPKQHVPVYKKWWLWTIVGVAAAGAAAGVAVAVTSQRTEASFMPVTVNR